MTDHQKQKPTPTPTRLPCPQCEKVVSLTKDGTLRRHGYQQNPHGQGGPACYGSGRTPHCVCEFDSRAAAIKGEPTRIANRCGIHGTP